MNQYLIQYKTPECGDGASIITAPDVFTATVRFMAARGLTFRDCFSVVASSSRRRDTITDHIRRS